MQKNVIYLVPKNKKVPKANELKNKYQIRKKYIEMSRNFKKAP